MTKQYLALARGVPAPRTDLWEMDVKRVDVPTNQRSGSKRHPRGRKDGPGRTAYRVCCTRWMGPDGTKRERGRREKDLRVSLLELTLLTGRTHQIRSHLLQAGHPLAGDVRYGDKEFNALFRKHHGLRRQFLHAYRLHLTHPVSGKKLLFTDAFSNDLAGLAQELRLGIPPVSPLQVPK